MVDGVHQILVDMVLRGTEKVNSQLRETSNQMLKWQNDLTRQLKTSQAEFRKALETKKLQSYTKQLNQVRDQFNSFGGVMRMPFRIWQKFNQAGGTFTTLGAKIANKTRMMTHGMRGFRMEMLSLMFGGMMLKQTMSSLLQPALEATGIFEIFGAMLQVFFLPIAMSILEILLPIMQWFMGAPEWVKIAVGAFALFLLILGGLLSIIGSLVLFLGGLALAWAVGFAPIIIGAALIAALIVAIVLLWKNWDKIWNWIKEKAKQVWDWFMTFVLIPVAGWFNKYIWIPISEVWNKTWDWVKSKVKGVWDWILVNVWQPVANWFNKWVVDPIKNAWQSLIDWIMDLWNKVKNIWESVVGGAKSIVGKVTGGALGSRQSGGYIPHTGMYQLHEGETVVPSNYSFNPTIYVNASSNVDINMLKAQLSSQWSEQLARLSR